MAERRIGIGEPKSELSECVREVRGGGTIVVTVRGRSVAQMIAEASSLRKRREVLNCRLRAFVLVTLDGLSADTLPMSMSGGVCLPAVAEDRNEQVSR